MNNISNGKFHIIVLLALSTLGLLFASQPQDVKSHLKSRILKDPFQASVYEEYKELCFKLKEFKEFREISQQLLKKNPNHQEILLALGEASVLMKNSDEGMEYFKQALSLNRNLYPKVFAFLEREKKGKEALEILDFLKAKISERDWLLTKARLMSKEAKNYGEGERIYKSLIKSYPNFEEGYIGLFYLYLKKGEMTKAKKLLLDLKEESEKKYYYLSKIYCYTQQYDSALPIIITFCQKFPHSNLRPELQELGLLLLSGEVDLKNYFAGLYYLDTDEVDKGITVLKQIKNSFALLKLSEVYQKRKETNLAMAALEEAMRLDAGYFKTKAQYELARIYIFDLKNEERGLALLEELIINHPSSPYTPFARDLFFELQKKGIR